MEHQENVWKVARLAGIFLVIFLAVISVKELKSISYVGKEYPINIITVTGKGEAVSIPDIATFSFTVTETAKTVKEAQDAATKKNNSALVAIKAGGVTDKDIKTLSYNISPHYDYNQPACSTYVCPPGKSVLTGYDVSQTTEVKVRDLTKAGDLFGTIGSAGVQNVNGLTFTIDDLDSVKALARANAITKAQAKAQKIADALGLKIVKITSFYDNSEEQPYYAARESTSGIGGDMVKAQLAPQISTGEQKITASVSISYEIR